MDKGLWNVLAELKEKCKVVELSHVVSPETPHWSGFPDMIDDTLYNYKEHGFYANTYTLVSQYGTHVDAPCHFVEGRRALDSIGAEELILPLCVISIVDKAAADEDYAASVEDIKAWESEHGQIPEGAFVALRTDWSKREDMDNYDAEGNKHYPAWGIDAVKFLVEERNIAAIGHETTDTDPAVIAARDGFPSETYILDQQKFQVEVLTNLDQVPPTGALIVCGFPRVKGGSGFTARCYAVVEK